MQKLHFSITIDTPKEKVWNTMLEEVTYREWTYAFNPTESSKGSYFEGDWSTGSSMKFLGDAEDGIVYGMYARIKENRPFEFLSIQHLGEIIGGEEKPFPGMEGVEVCENYTFTEVDGGTRVDIDLDTNDEYKDMFEGMWPKALEKLKEISER